MYKVVRFFLFLFDPEKIHHFTFSLLKIGYPFEAWIWRKMFTIKDKRLEREVFGIKFPNPVGLAAGFDKDGEVNQIESKYGWNLSSDDRRRN